MFLKQLVQVSARVMQRFQPRQKALGTLLEGDLAGEANSVLVKFQLHKLAPADAPAEVLTMARMLLPSLAIKLTTALDRNVVSLAISPGDLGGLSISALKAKLLELFKLMGSDQFTSYFPACKPEVSLFGVDKGSKDGKAHLLKFSALPCSSFLLGMVWSVFPRRWRLCLARPERFGPQARFARIFASSKRYYSSLPSVPFLLLYILPPHSFSALLFFFFVFFFLFLLSLSFSKVVCQECHEFVTKHMPEKPSELLERGVASRSPATRAFLHVALSRACFRGSPGSAEHEQARRFLTLAPVLHPELTQPETKADVFSAKVLASPPLPAPPGSATPVPHCPFNHCEVTRNPTKKRKNQVPFFWRGKIRWRDGQVFSFFVSRSLYPLSSFVFFVLFCLLIRKSPRARRAVSSVARWCLAPSPGCWSKGSRRTSGSCCRNCAREP